MMKHCLEQHARHILAHGSRNRFFSSYTTRTLSSLATNQTLQSRIESAIHQKADISTALEQWRKQEGNQSNPSLVRGIVEKLRDSQKFRHALEVSDWMIKQNICKLVPEDFAARFHLIEKVLGLEEAEKFFESVPKNLRGESIYTALLNSYEKRSGREALDKAESTFKKMKELGLLLRSSPYNSMTSLYSSFEKIDKVDEILLEMKESEIEYDSVTVNNALRVYAAVSDIKTMEKFLADWEEKATIEWRTRLDMAKAYLRDGSKEKAKEMLIKTEELKDHTNLYEELMKIYGEVGEREDVYRIWNLYKKTREQSNEGFIALIESLLKLDDVEGAEEIYNNEWERSGLEFDVRLPVMLANGYREKGMVEKADELLNKKTMRNIRLVRPVTPLLQELGAKGKVSDLRDLIKSLIDSHQFSKALEATKWVDERRMFNLVPEDYVVRLHVIEKVLGLEEAEKYFETSIPEKMKDCSVYLTLLNCYTRSHKTLNKAEAVFEVMEGLGFLSKLSPFNSMISLYSQLGRRSEVENLVKKMKERNVEPDSVTLNNVLRLYAEETDIEAMEKYKIDDADKLEVRTTVAMGKAYEREGMLTKAIEITRSKKEAHRLWNEYKKKPEREESEREMISSLLKLGDVKGAEEVYGEWEPEGPKLDARIPGLLISRYYEENDEKKVREVVDSIRKMRKRMHVNMFTQGLVDIGPSVVFLGAVMAFGYKFVF